MSSTEYNGISGLNLIMFFIGHFSCAPTPSGLPLHKKEGNINLILS